MSKVLITQITVEQTLPLRCEILRPGLPESESVFPNDYAARAMHLGAWMDDDLVGVGSVFGEEHEQFVGADVWRLRGMAVDEELQGQGVGRAVLAAGVAYVAEAGARLLWCNARVAAHGFYVQAGFETHGEAFEIPTIGEHYLMSRAVGS